MTKLTKKAFSLAVAGFVAFTSTFGGTPISASAHETEISKDAVLTSADASEETYKVYFTTPESWTGGPSRSGSAAWPARPHWGCRS